MRAAIAFAWAMAAALGAVAVPAYAVEVQRVDNPAGIEAWLVEDHSKPIMAVAFAFAGGSSQDPAGQRGLTNLFTGLMYEGAGSLDSTAFKAALKALSVQLGFDFDRDSLYGEFIGPSASRDGAARLLGLALTTPRYDLDAVERVRNLILSGIRGRSPTSNGLLAFQAALYPSHIYGVWESGTAGSISAITVPQLRDLGPKILAQDNLKVAAIGDMDAAGVRALLNAAFAGLPAHARLVPIPEAGPPAAGRVDTTAAVTQTSIRFGGPALKRHDPDFLAAAAAIYIAGGRGQGSRLNDALVGGPALAKTVSLSLTPLERGAWFAGATTTAAEDVDRAIAIIRDETKRLAAEGPSAAELMRAQGYLAGSYLQQQAAPESFAMELMYVMEAGLGQDYVNRNIPLVAALTVRDVQRAAQRMFGGDMLFFTVGPPANR